MPTTARLSSILFILLAIVTTTWQASPASDAADNPDDDKIPDELILKLANIDKLQTSKEAGAAVLQLLGERSVGSPDELFVHKSAEVAIQAAWRRYSRIVPRRVARFGAGETIDPRDVERFAGFVEGRLMVTIPEWWEQALADPRNLPEKEKVIGYDWYELRQIKGDYANGTIALRIDDETQTVVPASSLKSVTFGNLDGRIGVAFSDKYLVLLSSVSDAGNASICCIDRSNAMELWNTASWGLGQLGARTGRPIKHFMSMQVHEDRVAIFGATRQGVYFECYALSDGKTIVRFSSTNWFVDQLPE